MANYIYFSRSNDASHNLALDEWMLDHVKSGDLILYFYVNAPSVIIGKNQNPWKECALSAMEKDSVRLVRRISGGGAVYHDLGNLNFSFNAGEGRYDKDRQHRFIADVVRSLGIPCAFSGRNDLLTDGKKFSGNAYCARGNAKQHHGTLLVSSDLSKIANYLTVDERKLRSKGVSSVRSRVCRLCDFKPGLSVNELKKIIPASFEREYGKAERFVFGQDARKETLSYIRKHRSRDWLFGKTPDFDYELDERFSFGSLDLLFSLKEGRIASLRVFTDANDDALPERLSRVLVGLPFDAGTLADALRRENDPSFNETADRIEAQGF